MGMVVRTNTNAINANRQLGMNNSQVAKSIGKLSSGFRINCAGDDASGLAISEKMKAQIKGLEQASSNSQDGISLVQTAEGAMTEVHNMLNRMTELATKSANGTIADKVDRDAIQAEVNQLTEEIDRIGDATNFNGINLLDGSLGGAGGSSATKGAASVTVDALTGALKDIAASKGTSKFTTGIAGAMAKGKGSSHTFEYKDKNGTAKSVTVEILGSSDTTVQYKVNGGEVKTAVTAGTTSGAHASDVIASTLKEALTNSDLGKLFDVTTNGAKIDFTAKDAGASKAEVSIMISDLDTTDTAVGTREMAGQTAGVDQYHQLDTTKLGLYDGTDTTKQNIFEINGKKFAFVASGTDVSSLAPDITAVEAAGTTPVSTDTAALVAKINEVFGKGTAEADATTDTSINFKTVEGKSSSSGEGLTLQVGDTNDEFNKVTVKVDDVRSEGLGIKGLDVSTQDAAGDAIDVIKNAINKVSTNRGNLGALQNRLEYAINNLDVTAENMTSANSRIRDTDMAKEMMNYTKMNVLTQSAQAMLAQANQQPQSILQLLQ